MANERRAAEKVCKSLHRKIRKLEARLQPSESTRKASAEESQARALEQQVRLQLLRQRAAERGLLIIDLKEGVQSFMVELKQVGNGMPPVDQTCFVPCARKRVRCVRVAAPRGARTIREEEEGFQKA